MTIINKNCYLLSTYYVPVTVLDASKGEEKQVQSLPSQSWHSSKMTDKNNHRSDVDIRHNGGVLSCSWTREGLTER